MTHEHAYKATSNALLRLIQPKMTAIANGGVKTATNTLSQVAVRRVRALDGPK